MLSRLFISLRSILSVLRSSTNAVQAQRKCDSSSEARDASENIENARLGYEIAVQLWIFSGEMIWQRLGTFLIVNSVLTGAVALLLSSDSENQWAIRAMCTMGVAICAIWIIVMERSLVYQKYYIDSAVEIEERYLAPVETTRRGRNLKNGVSFVVASQDVKHRLTRIQRFDARASSWIIIGCFSVLYLGGFVQSWFPDLTGDSSRLPAIEVSEPNTPAAIALIFYSDSQFVNLLN